MHHDDPLHRLNLDSAPIGGENRKSQHAVGNAVANTLETLLPQAARIVEDASRNISDAFLLIAKNAERQDEITREVLMAATDALADHAKLAAALADLAAESKTCADNIQKACQDTVSAMQFQDRNSQIIENAQNMLEIYRQLILAGERPDVAQHPQTKGIAETMYSYIRLSDMRNVFVQELKKRDIDISQAQLRSLKKNDDTELF